MKLHIPCFSTEFFYMKYIKASPLQGYLQLLIRRYTFMNMDGVQGTFLVSLACTYPHDGSVFFAQTEGSVKKPNT